MSTRNVGPVDAIWLHMDRPDNLMVIEGVMTLERTPDWDRFLQTLRRRVVDRYPVYRQRPVPARGPLLRPRWVDDDDFDLERHVRRAVLPTPGDDAALQAYVSQFLDQPLTRTRPLWEVHLIDGYRGGSAVYSRMHHAMADGIALMRVLLSMTDAAPDDDLHEATEQLEGDAWGWDHRDRAHAPVPVGGVLDASAQVAAAVGRTLAAAPRSVVPRLFSPMRTARESLQVARTALDAAVISEQLLLARNPDSPLAGRPGPRKQAVWGRPVPLDDVLDAAHRTGTTLNDVVVAALAGAMRTYQRERGAEPGDVPTMVPVNVRPLDEPLPPELGNRFALVLLSLPAGLATPFARLAETHRRMDQIKHSPEVSLTFGIIRAIGLTGPYLERVLVDFFANKATGVTTNVPGPRGARYLAGTRVTGLLGWAPGSGEQTINTCICSYDGELSVGFKVDTEVVPDPDRLVAAFEDELAALCVLAPGARAAAVAEERVATEVETGVDVGIPQEIVAEPVRM